jgi:ABC-type transport system involved in multi-copper enzyme maturation permease subunit
MTSSRNTGVLNGSFFVALLTWLDLVRRKDLYVVLICMMLYVIGTVATRIIGIHDAATAHFLMSAGFSLCGILAALLGISLASRAFPEEFEHGTLMTLLAKPVSRIEVVFGKTIAIASLVLGSYLVFVAMTLMAVPSASGIASFVLVQVVVLQLLSLLLLCMAVLACSMHYPAMVTAVVAILWYFGTGTAVHMIERTVLLRLPGWDNAFERVLSWIPDPSMFGHVEAFAGAHGALSPALFWGLCGYGILWSIAFFLYAAVRFERIRL